MYLVFIYVALNATFSCCYPYRSLVVGFFFSGCFVYPNFNLVHIRFSMFNFLADKLRMHGKLNALCVCDCHPFMYALIDDSKRA